VSWPEAFVIASPFICAAAALIGLCAMMAVIAWSERNDKGGDK